MLIRSVNTQQIFFARGLREDHYVDVSMKDDKLILRNDIPNKEVEFNKCEVEKLYSNSFLELKYKSFYSTDQISYIGKQKKYPIPTTFVGIDTEVLESNNFLIVFRNTLVLLKTMRERLKEYMIAKNYTCNISDELVEINKLMVQTEYMRLRKNLNKKEYANLIIEINRIDEEILKKVKDVIYDRNNQWNFD